MTSLLTTTVTPVIAMGWGWAHITLGYLRVTFTIGGRSSRRITYRIYLYIYTNTKYICI